MREDVWSVSLLNAGESSGDGFSNGQSREPLYPQPMTLRVAFQEHGPSIRGHDDVDDSERESKALDKHSQPIGRVRVEIDNAVRRVRKSVVSPVDPRVLIRLRVNSACEYVATHNVHAEFMSLIDILLKEAWRCSQRLGGDLCRSHEMGQNPILSQIDTVELSGLNDDTPIFLRKLQ